MTKEAHKIEVELEKLNKNGLAALCGKLEIEPHSKKAVMVNRLRLQIEEGNLVTTFDEPAFDPEIELTASKPKKVKEPKPERTYNWQDSPWAGRQVYTSAGTGHILQQENDEEGKEAFFLVRLADGTEKAVNAKTTRFTAVADGYRERYIVDNTVRTQSGAPSIHSGSNISYALLGTTLEELASVAKENGLSDKYDSYLNRDKPLNPGMIRMNIGNILLARFKKGQAVTIFGETDMQAAAEKGQARAKKEAEAAEERKKAAAKARSEEAEAKRKEKAEAKAAKAKEKAEAAPKAEKPAKKKAA